MRYLCFILCYYWLLLLLPASLCCSFLHPLAPAISTPAFISSSLRLSLHWLPLLISAPCSICCYLLRLGSAPWLLLAPSAAAAFLCHLHCLPLFISTPCSIYFLCCFLCCLMLPELLAPSATPSPPSFSSSLLHLASPTFSLSAPPIYPAYLPRISTPNIYPEYIPRISPPHLYPVSHPEYLPTSLPASLSRLSTRISTCYSSPS